MSEPVVRWPPMLALAAAGKLILKQQYICADTMCGAYMQTLLPECPRCGGSIVGTIKHANDRLDALEDYEQRQKEHAS